MIKTKKVVAVFSVLLFTMVMFTPVVFGESLLPPVISAIVGDGENASQTVINRVQVGFLLAFGFIILAAVFFTIGASLKYIKSKGEPGEIENSHKAMQAIFMGVAALFVGLLGIAVVLLFFGSTIASFDMHPICISYPDSVGCYACKNIKLDPNGETCEKCDADDDSVVDMEKDVTVRAQFSKLLKSDDDQKDGTCKVSVKESK